MSAQVVNTGELMNMQGNFGRNLLFSASSWPDLAAGAEGVPRVCRGYPRQFCPCEIKQITGVPRVPRVLRKSVMRAPARTRVRTCTHTLGTLDR